MFGCYLQTFDVTKGVILCHTVVCWPSTHYEAPPTAQWTQCPLEALPCRPRCLKCVVERSLGPVLGHNHCEILGASSTVVELHQCTLSIGENPLLQHWIGAANPGLAIVDADGNEMWIVVRPTPDMPAENHPNSNSIMLWQRLQESQMKLWVESQNVGVIW